MKRRGSLDSTPTIILRYGGDSDDEFHVLEAHEWKRYTRMEKCRS